MRRWSWKLGRIAGVEIYIHITFLGLVLWIAVGQALSNSAVAEVVTSVLFVVAVFATIVMHELGHALVARRYGISTRDITLYPIGGVAKLERMPRDPKHELAVALAGPAVSFTVAATLFAGHLVAGRTPMPSLDLGHALAANLAWANLVIAIFNLVPAFPMDGGRAFRALLAMRLDYLRATRIAASLGQGLAVLFAVFGLVGNPVLLFIALFIWVAASAEAASTELHEALRDVSVAVAMQTDLRVLSPEEPISWPAELASHGHEGDFLVVENDRLAGALTRSRLLELVSRGRGTARVAEGMERDLPLARPDETVADVLDRVGDSGHRAVVVVDGGRVLGLLALERLGDWVSLRGAKRPMPPRAWTGRLRDAPS